MGLKALCGLFPPTLQPLSLQPIHTGPTVSLITGLACSCLRAFTHTVPVALNALSSNVHMLFTCSQRPSLGTPQSNHLHSHPSSSMIYFLCDSVFIRNSLVYLFGDFNILYYASSMGGT